jgi:hypothetical protein
MRALFVVVMGLLLSTAVADARPRKRDGKKRVAVSQPEERRSGETKSKPHDGKPGKKGKKKTDDRKSRAQSFGAPWSGSLKRATKFRAPERTHVRRPHRAFASRTTIEHTRRAIIDTLESFPKAHTLAIGDFSAERGGWISEHSSHQNGRDVDLGLFYKKRPSGYPASFIDADEDTLHTAAMWLLIVNLDSTRKRDGGVHMMFLDFELQGVIYNWALDNGVSEERLNRIFQYPHGRGASAGIVRHEPNHGDHLHVRFRCAAADTGCR